MMTKKMRRNNLQRIFFYDFLITITYKLAEMRAKSVSKRSKMV
ncbi:MAG: hypothetical protein RL757_54 [Bacteroidota bacterium]|jgi:hypothetical protein